MGDTWVIILVCHQLRLHFLVDSQFEEAECLVIRKDRSPVRQCCVLSPDFTPWLLILGNVILPL